MTSVSNSHPSTFRRFLAGGAALALVLSVPAGAQDEGSISDLRRQRESERDAEAAAIRELELLSLEDDRIGEIVAEMQAAVDNQAVQVQAARQELGAAEAEVAERERAAAEAATELDRAAIDIRNRAVEAFVGTTQPLEPWLTSSDLNQTAIRLAMLDFAAGTDRNLLDDLRAYQADREAHLRAGEEAQAEADALRLVLEEELAELESRRAVQNRIQDEIQARIAEWEREADQRDREAEELTQLILQRQAQELGFEPGDPGAASVQGFVMPTEGSIGSGFGIRRHPIFNSSRMHAGVDIGAPTGQAVWTSKEGRVIFAAAKGGYGNTVIVQHEGNVATLYAHLSAFRSSEGDWVEGGEVVGLIGSTGWSTGPHLHFETRVDGVAKDPQLFLPG